MRTLVAVATTLVFMLLSVFLYRNNINLIEILILYFIIVIYLNSEDK